MPGARKPRAKLPAGEPARQPAASHEEAVWTIVRHLRAEREAIRRAWVSEMARRGFGKLLSPAEAEIRVRQGSTTPWSSAWRPGATTAPRPMPRTWPSGTSSAGIGAKQVIGAAAGAAGRVRARPVAAGICQDCGRGERQRLDLYEPVVNRILTIVAMAFLQERERAVGRGREQLGALVEAGKALGAERSLDRRPAADRRGRLPAPRGAVRGAGHAGCVRVRWSSS